MQKLTENVIQQIIKPCPTDLSKITKLNITERGLTDISLIKNLVGLEVVSLSINNISSLACFVNCKKLRELYLRQNKIEDLNEIKYLMNLPQLEVLTLSQNPCTKNPFYRYTVIKNLKRLIELDDIFITEGNRIEAELLGKNLLKQVNSAYVVNSREGFQMRGSRSKLNEALKMSSTSISPRMKKCYFDQHQEKESKRDVLIGGEHTSDSINAMPNYSRSYFDEIIPKLLSVESLSALSPSQCQIFQGSKIDFDSSSLHALPVIEEPEKPSSLLMAILLLIRNLEYPDLRILNAELRGIENSMILPDSKEKLM